MKLRLGRWLCAQRLNYRRGKLKPDRLKLLQSLVEEGKLSWDNQERRGNDAAWEKHYKLLLQWSEEHDGDCNMPVTGKVLLGDGSIAGVGLWLYHQRAAYRSGSLRKDREEILQALVTSGRLEWLRNASEINTDNDSWDEKFDLLKKHAEENNNDCNVNLYHRVEREAGPPVLLGRWLNKQRADYRAGTLRSDRQERLQTLVDQKKLTWFFFDYDWDVRFSSLKSLAEKYGTVEAGIARHRKHHTYDHGHDEGISRWLTYQKRSRQRGKLLASREKQLQLLVDQGLMFWD
eukprot:CAMPEP_0182431622 /NCGR_PEP_ID=MMETSP1167-20130531/50620_1 /TAXON_ID=2988 /ORGANISM="Mallomonas Sp, Strain CCMP3275" /LENGTH=289 /DNA_ID=CAMNT_0024618175 /DNA_START=663 /DNA_END=1532 /DNA_ORIENTATION=-